MSATVKERYAWDASQTKEGHRDYSITWLVKTTAPADDGPYTIGNASGLAAIGSTWGYGNDNDLWAFCTPQMEIEHHPDYGPGDPAALWLVTQHFSTQTPKRCQDTEINNPLLEPFDLSGSSSNYTKEAVQDRNGNFLVTTSHELLRGAQVEVPDPRHIVNVSWNLASIDFASVSQTHKSFPLNDAVLWGMPKRCVRFADWRWRMLLYGTCTQYFNLSLEFELKHDTHDPLLANRGMMKLPDGISANDPDPEIPGITIKQNPKNFVANKDKLGNHVPTWLDLDGHAISDIDDAILVNGELLGESNLLLLGIPSSIPPP